MKGQFLKKPLIMTWKRKYPFNCLLVSFNAGDNHGDDIKRLEELVKPYEQEANFFKYRW